MAQNQSDVKLRLSAETAGVEGIKDLSKEIRDVAKSGGDAAPQFERLANELDELAKQQALIDQLSKVNKEVDEVNASLTQGRAKVEDYRRTLDDQRATLVPLQQAYDGVKQRVLDAKEAVTNANIAWREAKARQAELRSEVQAGERATKEQIAAQRAAADVVKETKKALEDARLAQAKVNVENVKAKDAYDTVAKAVAKTEGELKRVEKQADRTEQQYTELNREVAKISTAMVKVGVDSTNLANAQVKVAQAIQRVTTEAQSLDAALGTVADELRRAFDNSTLGRVKALTDEIDRLERGYMDLARSGKYSDEQLRQMATGVKARVAEAKGEIDKLTNGVEKVGDAADGLRTPLAGVGTAIAAAFSVEQVVEATKVFDSARRTLSALGGSAEEGARQLDYVRNVADRLGVSVSDAAKSYASLIAATQSSDITMEQARGTFEAVSGAMSMLGRSSADIEGALLALQQMASKGNVTMEELRQQLGDRLPGALPALAKELGITTADLNKMVESGQILASDVFPALETALKKTFVGSDKEIKSVQAELQRLKNTAIEAAAALGGSEGENVSFVAKTLATFLSDVKVAAVAAGGGLSTLGQLVRDGAFDVLEYAKSLFGAKTNTDMLAISTDNFYANLGSLRERLKEAAFDSNVFRVALESLGVDFDKQREKQQGVERETKRLSEGWIALSRDTNLLTSALDDKVAAQNKVIRRTEEQVTASNNAAKSFGTEGEQANVAAQGAEAMGNAYATLLGHREMEIEALERQGQAMLDLVVKNGGVEEARVKEIESIYARIEAAKVNVDALRAQVKEQDALAAKMQTQAQITLDNSARLGELRDAYGRARQEVEQLRVAVDNGTASQERLVAAETAAGQAKLLYNDAIKDQIADQEALTTAKQATLSVEEAGIRLAITQQQAILEVARARGDERGAIEALTQIKRLELELARLSAEMKREDARASKLIAEAEIEEIRASGEMTDAKRAEIAALEASIRVKELEAEIAGVTAEKLKELAGITERAGLAASGAAGGYDRMAGSLRSVAEAADAATNAVQRAEQANRDAQSAMYGGGGGTQAPQYVDPRTVLYKAGASIDEAKAGSSFFNELMQRKLAASSGREPNLNAMSRAAAEEALQLVRAQAAGAQVDLGSSFSDQLQRTLATSNIRSERDLITATQNAASRAAAQSSVTINLGGRATKINVASPSDVQNLTNMLKQLEQAAGSAY